MHILAAAFLSIVLLFASSDARANQSVPSSAGFTNPSFHSSRGGAAICVSGDVAVQASTSTNIDLKIQEPTNETEVVNMFLELLSMGSPYGVEITGGFATVGGNYTIAATLCTPTNNTAPSGVQFLTHGIGFDRYYWDFAPGYSYVDVATEHNYATFLYDRLGVGESEKPEDGINGVQPAIEVAIANQLASMLRKGKFANNAFEKVVGAGHSFGSSITQAVTAEFPNTLDAAIITGLTISETAAAPFLLGFNPDIASENQPKRFAGLPDSYIVASSVISNQIAFFRAPNFDPKILNLVEATKSTATIGELFASGSGSAATNFTKPVAFVNGLNDFPFCYGNCSYPDDLTLQALVTLYPNVAEDQRMSYNVPGVGHGVNLHYAATEVFEYIQAFIQKHV